MLFSSFFFSMDTYVQNVHFPESEKVSNPEKRMNAKNRTMFDLKEHVGICPKVGNEMFQFYSLFMPEFSAKELRRQVTSYLEFEFD